MFPEMIAPACPIRLSAGADKPAIKAVIGFFIEEEELSEDGTGPAGGPSDDVFFPKKKAIRAVLGDYGRVYVIPAKQKKARSLFSAKKLSTSSPPPSSSSPSPPVSVSA